MCGELGGRNFSEPCPRGWQLPLAGAKERKEVAKNLREISSLENQTKDEYIMDVNQSEVIKIIENHSVDVLIHGHTHRPFVHDENGVPRMVLGDWGDFLWFIESSEGNLNLLKEKI